MAPNLRARWGQDLRHRHRPRLRRPHWLHRQDVRDRALGRAALAGSPRHSRRRHADRPPETAARPFPWEGKL